MLPVERIPDAHPLSQAGRAHAKLVITLDPTASEGSRQPTSDPTAAGAAPASPGWIDKRKEMVNLP